MLQPCAKVELVWQDDSGSTATTTLHAPSSLTTAEIDVSITVLASILASLTGAVLVATRIRYITEPFLPVLVTGTPIVKTGVFFFTTDGDASDGSVIVPSIDSAILLTDGPTSGIGIDLSNPDVIAFAAAVIDGGMSNPFADLFTSLTTAYLQSRV